MDRLVKRPVWALYNKLDANSMAFMIDSKLDRAILHSKDGKFPSIIGDNLSTGAVPGSPSGTQSTTIERMSKQSTTDGQYQGTLIDIVAPAPCDDCDYPYALTIKKRVRRPGVNTSIGKQNFERSYAGELQIVESDSGRLEEAYRREILYQLVNKIYSDDGEMNINDNLESNKSGRWVDPHVVIKVTLAHDTNEVLLLKGRTGNTIATVTFDGANMVANIANAKIDLPSGWEIWAVSDNDLMIKAPVGTYFYGSSSTIADAKMEEKLLLLSKDLKVQFDVYSRYPGQYTFNPFGLIYIDNSGGSSSGDSTFVINNVAYTPDNDDTTATYVSNVNTAIDGYGYAAVVTGDIVALYFNENTKSVNFKLGTGPALSTSYNVYTPTGKWSSWDYEQVFRQFANSGGHGPLSRYKHLDQPVPGSEYYIYTIVLRNSTAGHYSPDSEVTQFTTIHLVVDQDYVSADYLDKDDPDNSSPDTTFEEALGIITGVAVASW